jgi:hypothetical protein
LPFQAWPADPYEVPPAAFFLAALVGPHDALRALAVLTDRAQKGMLV